MEKTTNVVCRLDMKTHLNPSKFTDVFFLLVYSLLLKIIANAITKAIAMIVAPRSPKYNMYIVETKCNVSTISLTSLLEANHICYFSFPTWQIIQYRK